MIRDADILATLQERTGLDASQIGEAAVCRVLRKTLSQRQPSGSLLDPESSEWNEFIHSILVPETWFFRNHKAFEALSSWVMKNWLPRHAEGALRILSLPCATGEEPYSIAMHLLEAGIPPSRFIIQAGDIGSQFLEKAEQAVYGKNSFRESFDGSRFEKYFSIRPDGRKELRQSVRDLVHFQFMNLTKGDLPASDVIFCRNALIYFHAEAQQKILQRLHATLADDGIIFFGPVEPPLALRNGFSPVSYPMAFACEKAKALHPETPVQTRETARKTGRKIRIPAKKKPAPAQSSKPVFAAPHANNPAEPPDSPEQVRELADRGALNEAANMLARLTSGESLSAELYCLSGTICEARGQTDAAEQFYRKAIYLEPNHTEALMHLGLLLEISGRRSAAVPLRQRLRRQLEL